MRSGLGWPCTWYGSVVKNLYAVPETQETEVRSLGREDSLVEGMATHSSVLAGKTPWTLEPGGLQSMELQKVRQDLATKQQHHLRE